MAHREQISRGETTKMKIKIASFTVETKTVKFKTPLMLKARAAGLVRCLTHEELNLSACEQSWSECVDSIREELAMLWDDYVLAPADELSADAIALKNKLLGMVEEDK